MKKLKLNVAELGATEILTREELKKILGGKSYNCTRSKGNTSVHTTFSDASGSTINSWEAAWQSLGWSTSCTTMPIVMPGSGSGSGSYYV